MKILVACECSGIVKSAFRKRGHDAWSCDTKPSEIPDDSYHIQGDVIPVLTRDWDLMIAHPPCTYLSNSGVVWLHTRPERAIDLCQGIKFFLQLKNANIDRIAIENPIPHLYARQFIGYPDEIVHPWWFGDQVSKATCLWLKNLPPLVASTAYFPNRNNDWHTSALGLPTDLRRTARSRTFHGFAEAMADQWGSLV